MKTSKITINQAFFENDAIVMLIDRLGHESVGIVLQLFTMIAANDYSLSYSQADIIRLRHKLFGISKETLARIVETCVELGIFNLDDYVEHACLTSPFVQRTHKSSAKVSGHKGQCDTQHERQDRSTKDNAVPDCPDAGPRSCIGKTNAQTSFRNNNRAWLPHDAHDTTDRQHPG
ncbi:MAG: DUF4373 domain-containing protein [Odoribacter sp.]|nr:DUF4373 domain-containing protein [Odoribacter sp.]